MKKLIKITSIITTIFLTGCVSGLPNMLNSNLDQSNQQSITFKTNQVRFMNGINNNSSQNERNIYLDEFILKSDMQCQNYLNSPLQKAKTDDNKDSLYMGIFDTVSGLFGMSLATNAAKAVFLDKDGESSEDKRAYANALSPEIRKGVELGRSRFARSMGRKKGLNLKAYSINNLREDTLKYDKQCDDAYGLIEINRALKEMQNNANAKNVSTIPTLNIDPRAIKAKVEAASKKVEEKKVEKAVKAKVNVSKVPPTQSVPVDVPPRRGNAQHLPRSTQPLNE